MCMRGAGAAALVLLFGSAAWAGFVGGRPLGTVPPFRDLFPTGPHAVLVSAPEGPGSLAPLETFVPFSNLPAASATPALAAPGEALAPPAVHSPETTGGGPLPALPLAPPAPADTPGPARVGEPTPPGVLPPSAILVPSFPARQDEPSGNHAWRGAVLSRAFEAVVEGEDWAARMPAIFSPGGHQSGFAPLGVGQELRPPGSYAHPTGENASTLSTGERTAVAALLSAFLATLIYTGRKGDRPA